MTIVATVNGGGDSFRADNNVLLNTNISSRVIYGFKLLFGDSKDSISRVTSKTPLTVESTALNVRVFLVSRVHSTFAIQDLLVISRYKLCIFRWWQTKITFSKLRIYILIWS